jgi:two-component system, OmpR family, sensor kinase
VSVPDPAVATRADDIAPAGEAADPPAGPVRHTLGGRLHGMPLRARMVAIIGGVLLIALTLTGVTALALLRPSLVEQVDVQLSAYARPLVAQASGRGPDRFGEDAGTLPSDYYIEVLDATGTEREVLATADTTGAGTPRLPAWTREQVDAADGEAITVVSDRGVPWRAVMLPGVVRGGDYVTVAVALPLTRVERTLDQMRTALVLTGLGVIALGSLAGWVAVRRSLRPLQEMEATAAAIAAGDLSRRVPARPSSTEVGRLGEALNAMLGQIERAFAERAASQDRMRRFVADASHELRTPLATIRGYSELYRMGALTEPHQLDETIRRIEDSATRMGRLVEDLLHLARLDEGRPMRADPVDLTVLAADAVSDLHALDPGRPVRIRSLTPGADLASCVVVGDEDRLRQVLANLTGNVAQHTPRGTPVEIAVGHAGGPAGRRVVVEVRDSGPGIAPEHAARVFERFYRVDASRTRESGGGAGLGMAIVAAIVGANGGSVRTEPTPGGGTTVRVELPAADVPRADPDPDDADRRAGGAGAPAPAAGGAAGGPDVAAPPHPSA